jgi:hypothetical protein
MKKAIGSLAASLALGALAFAPSANAATEFGDTCSGTEVAPALYTLVTLSSPATDLPLSAPVSGVITKVKLKRDFPIPVDIPEIAKVLRPTGGDNYTVINQTTIQTHIGSTEVDARMPVQAGDKLGIAGQNFTYEGTPVEGFTFYCDEAPGIVGAIAGDVGVGSNAHFEAVTEARVPLAAVIEPDADGDGYGDETQDLCPQDAAVQTACPLVVLDASTLAGKKAVTIYVAVSSEGPVSVKGVVKLGKGKKVTLKTAPKAAYPGKIASFRLKFNRKLKKRLRELPRKKKLTLKITASATNVVGQISTDRTKAKLKGQAR